MRPTASCKAFSTRVIVAAVLCAASAPSAALAVSGPPGFVVESAFPGETFNQPVQIVFLPGDRKLVVEQGGVVWVMTAAGTRTPTPFIDLSAKVLSNPSSGRGLLGVVLDPDFSLNRWVYLAYTVDPDSDGVDDNDEAYARIERYQVDATDDNRLDLTTRQVLIGTDWPSGIPCADTYHTVGALRFGSDKTLLIASGESAHYDATDAGGIDPGQFLPGRTNPAEDLGAFRSLTLNSLAGKILRIDKETGQGLPSNPYWDGNPVSSRSRVWVYGVRNPYRFALRPGTGSSDPSLGQPGTLYIGETGWNTYERVNIAKQGGMNMGWPCYEGPSQQPLYQAVTATAAGNTNVLCGAAPSAENPVGVTPPLLWWNHLDGSLSNPLGWTGNATTGGTFHQGSSYPQPYAAAYFVGELSAGWVRWVRTDANDNMTSYGDFLTDADGPVDLEWDPVSGNLFYVAIFTGEVRRIRYLLSNELRSVFVRADSASGSGPFPSPGTTSPWKDLASTHDVSLSNFAGDASSGWQGDGTVLSPYRLSFDGVDDYASIPAGSIPELASPTAVTTALWIRTGPDVTTTQYLFEWLSEYTAPYHGMSMAISGGQLRVCLNPWVDVAPVSPNTWYHVATVKDAGSARVFLNGQLVYSGVDPNLGGQLSEIVLGASTFRGPGTYGEFFHGSIAQMSTWPAALSEGEILAGFQAGQPLFFPSGPKVVHLRADSSAGSGPYPVPGATSPWMDRIYSHDATLAGFSGTSTSGWQGNGTIGSPYRLAFDGVDDHAVIPAGTVPELKSPSTVTVSLWVKTGPDVTTTQYLLEWVSQFASPYPGMTMVISGGNFRVQLSSWTDVAPVLPNTWYYLTVVKDASGGAVRAYVNEFRKFTSSDVNLGPQNSEIVLGASTFRGAGSYGEYFTGSIAQVRIWRSAMLDPEVQEAYHEGSDLYFEPAGISAKIVSVRADSATGTAPYPVPGSGTPWVNLMGSGSGPSTDATLSHFQGTATSGWQGDGSPASPRRLQFDGIDDRVTFAANRFPALAAPTAVTTSVWVRTGSDVTSTQYVLEWLAQFTAPYPGMSLAIENGNARLRLSSWVDLAPVLPDHWYELAVTKTTGTVTAFINGQQVYSGTDPNLGGQASEIVLGASTFRGKKLYGEFFKGAIAEMCTWGQALDPRGVLETFHTDSPLYFPPGTVGVGARQANVAVTAAPNPFHRSSAIEFSLNRAGPMDLSIYSVDGRLVRALVHGWLPAGPQRFEWDGRSTGGRIAAAGVYFARLTGPDGNVVRRLVLLR